MASNHESKKIREGTEAQDTGKARGRKSAPKAATITSVVPVQTLAASQWEQDGDDGLAAALRVFFLSHTLDPLTGEVHTVH
jgi:hypothetical protein